ncbi:MAG: sterol desaturase family protein [Luteitalea sp.]|nr:sterol desaturase family protein [Luteitalea sp.]
MVNTVITHESLTRLAIFLAILVAMAVWELLAPRRPQDFGRRLRWPANLGIAVIDTLSQRVVLPSALVGFALLIESRGWGLFGVLGWPALMTILASIIALDLLIYLQHVLFHAVPVLWRLHRMHHSDLECDVTTGVRFHPVEHLLSMGFKVAAIAALGAPPVAVLAFEVLLNATSMFNHANIRMPRAIDHVLRWIVVTPDMHRVHHSVRPEETNSNFGFNLPWWDRLLGTYRPGPAAGHDGMTLGVEQFRSPRDLRLRRLLIQPFLDPSSDYSIHRQTENSHSGGEFSVIRPSRR